MEDQGIPFTRKLPLGFTFSFPCEQAGLSRYVAHLDYDLNL